MKKHPNPNLWSITVREKDLFGRYSTNQLLICAATSTAAGSKAVRHLKASGSRGARVMKIEHEGTIDVF